VVLFTALHESASGTKRTPGPPAFARVARYGSAIHRLAKSERKLPRRSSQGKGGLTLPNLCPGWLSTFTHDRPLLISRAVRRRRQQRLWPEGFRLSAIGPSPTSTFSTHRRRRAASFPTSSTMARQADWDRSSMRFPSASGRPRPRIAPCPATGKETFSLGRTTPTSRHSSSAIPAL
jgi:hypothetical protein